MKSKKTKFNIILFVLFTTVYFLLCYNFKHFLFGSAGLRFEFQSKFLEFVYLKNTGAAFSLLDGFNFGLAFFAVIIVAAFLYYVFRNSQNMNILTLNVYSSLIAGILSNMAERFVDGYVTDYFLIKLSESLFKFSMNKIEFPVFNLADVFIVISAIVLSLYILFGKSRLKSE
ncbi:signal peptidase II [bacterium]|nr:signal peptidase II [bacterium]